MKYYSENAKMYLDIALKIFEEFCEQGVVSKIEQIKFCIAVEKFQANFKSWHSCYPAEANAYQVFVKSTPLAPLLELPQAQWARWLEENVTEKINV